jgi:hypothetical protein
MHFGIAASDDFLMHRVPFWIGLVMPDLLWYVVTQHLFGKLAVTPTYVVTFLDLLFRANLTASSSK